MNQIIIAVLIAYGNILLASEADQNLPPDVLAFQKACDGGSNSSCYNLGTMYHFGNAGVRQNIFKAVDLYKKACDGGASSGCHRLGWMYDKGEGVEKDKAKSVEFYKKAAALARAVVLYKKACDGGYAEGCYNLGRVYDRGYGVRKNKSRALYFFGKACDLKHEDGCKAYAEIK